MDGFVIKEFQLVLSVGSELGQWKGYWSTKVWTQSAGFLTYFSPFLSFFLIMTLFLVNFFLLYLSLSFLSSILSPSSHSPSVPALFSDSLPTNPLPQFQTYQEHRGNHPPHPHRQVSLTAIFWPRSCSERMFRGSTCTYLLPVVFSPSRSRLCTALPWTPLVAKPWLHSCWWPGWHSLPGSGEGSKGSRGCQLVIQEADIETQDCKGFILEMPTEGWKGEDAELGSKTPQSMIQTWHLF